MADPVFLVLRPGDRVLIALVDEPTEHEAVQYTGQLGAAFPGTEFTVIGGVAGLVVQPPDVRKLP